jgi:hypothetical protein
MKIFLSPAEMLYMYPDPGLFVRAFSAGLTDSNTLVQRGFLELLLKNVPLNLPVLQKYKLLMMLSYIQFSRGSRTTLDKRSWCGSST